MKFCWWMLATKVLTVSLTPALLVHAESGRPSDIAIQRAFQSHIAPSVSAGPKITALAAHPRSKGGNFPRAELFLGYSRFQGVATLKTENRMVELNGGVATVAFNVTHYLGVVADFGGYGDTKLRLTQANGASSRVAPASGAAYTYLSGPRLSYRGYSRIAPFAQVLFGGVHATEVTLSRCTGPLCTPLPGQNSFAMVAGGGFDMGVFRHASIRVIQVEYVLTRFGSLTPGVSTMQNDLRLSSGLVLCLGGSSGHASR
jgi:hypothetical protein